MTIEQLKERCEEAIKNGDGDRDIVVCSKGEFSALEGGFSSPVYNEGLGFYEAMEDEGFDREEADNFIVLN